MLQRVPSNHDHHGVPGSMTVRSFVQKRQQPSWNQSQAVLMNNKNSVRLASNRISLPKLRTPLAVTNNNEVEIKFLDVLKKIKEKILLLFY